MISKGRKKDTIRFVFNPDNGEKKVAVAGDFNNWQPETMRRQNQGYFVKSFPLSSGVYEYKFVVDGHWLHDPDHHDHTTNSYGALNSVVRV